MYQFDRTTQFTIDNLYAGFNSIDFWEWFSSFHLDASTRGGLAEFIVMKALGFYQERNIWEPYDLFYNGYKIEVKSASLYTCKNKIDGHYQYTKNSRIYYSIEPHHRHVIKGEWTSKNRHSDFYVLTLLTDIDSSKLENWSFYIIKTTDMNRLFGNQKTLSLSSLENHGFKSVGYSDLKSTFDIILNGGTYRDMTKSKKPVIELLKNESQDDFALELQRLILCYQEASKDDRNVVWAALNKYACKIDKL